jgi:hypothetical protein
MARGKFLITFVDCSGKGNAIIMDNDKRLSIFVQLGKQLSSYLEGEIKDGPVLQILEEAIYASKHQNLWFDEASQRTALYAISCMLQEDSLMNWLQLYPELRKPPIHQKTIALILAGNIPLVGFHDYLCVMMSGHEALIKLSSDDAFLLPALHKLLCAIDDKFENRLRFSSSVMKDFDAVIATGSNNSARYFDAYFSKYPHIIRRNRNAVALLHGNENTEDFLRLGEDVFTYYGLGCRNVTKLYVPESYDFTPLLNSWNAWGMLRNHSRFFNNYEYHKAVYLVNTVPHLDTGFLLLSRNTSIASPVAVLYYDFYSTAAVLKEEILLRSEEIQCAVGDTAVFPFCLPFGSAQTPGVTDYADGVDTMKFLEELGR